MSHFLFLAAWSPWISRENYAIFNLVEGVVWIAIALYLLGRIKKIETSRRKWAWPAVPAFVLFGISDFLEAPYHGHLPPSLWALKIACGVILFACRLGYLGRSKKAESIRLTIFGLVILGLVIAIQFVE